MPLVDKLFGHQNTFPDKPYLEQPNNGDKFCQGTVYVPTKKRVHIYTQNNFNCTFKTYNQ